MAKAFLRKFPDWFNSDDEKAKRRIKIACLLVSAFLFLIFAFQLWLHINRTSPTFDEPLHTLAGYWYWQCGNYAFNPEHPPLVKLLAALPIASESFTEPSLPCDAKINYKLEGFIVGAQFLSRNDIEFISHRTRLAASLMSLFLAVMVFLAAREMFGWPEAGIALAILAFEPVLIAHGSLVTTDMAISATSFAAVFALYRYVKRPGATRLLVTGLALGLMMAAKHTALLMLPLLFLLLVIDVFIFRSHSESRPVGSQKALRHIGAFVLMGVITLGVLWAMYGFKYRALPESNSAAVSLADIVNMGFDHDAINTRTGQMVKALHESHLVPEAYTLGLADIIGSGSRPTFLLGKGYPTGQWFYFPVVFIIKSSAVLLILLLISLLYVPLYKRYPREMLFLLVPAAGYLAISLTFGLNIGIRHILPVYPFFIVIAAAGAGALVRRFRGLIPVLVIILLFHMAEAARTAPDYIAFSNDFWGGSNNTYRYLGDSNVEWSQNFKLIGKYTEQNKIRNCYLSGLGLGEVLSHYQSCQILPGGFVLNSPGQVSEPVPPVIDGTVFISTAAVTPMVDPEFEIFFRNPPVTMLGGSIFVFNGHFEIPALAARRHIERVSQLIDLKQFEEAAADGQKAVELAPQDARAHLSLGWALSRTGWNDKARSELEEAIRLADVKDESTKQAAQKILEKLPGLR